MINAVNYPNCWKQNNLYKQLYNETQSMILLFELTDMNMGIRIINFV